MELYHKGSVKDIYYGNNDQELIFIFSDRISVFDCPIPSEVPRKGEAICECTVHWFERCADLGIKTHYLGREGKNSIRVKKVAIERDYSKIPGMKSVLVPLEFIMRHYVAGSFNDRLKKGKITDPKYTSLTFGDKMPHPFFELTTKLEPVDRSIERAEALSISGLSEEELQWIESACLKVDTVMEEQVNQGGLVHVDGKKEFGRDEVGDLMLVDVFGTPDEDRFWDLEKMKQGDTTDLSKEHVRNYYRESGFKDELYKARDEGREEPPIPPMPEKVIAETSEIYLELTRRLTGKTL